MRVLFYGGSFDPPHLGHMHAARAAQAALEPDKLLLIPDNLPPHKELSESSCTASDRLRLTRLAAASIPFAEVSDMELRRGGRSYTYDTVTELARLYEDAELIMLVGTDMLKSLDRWYRAAELARLCSFCVVSRSVGDMPEIESATERLHGELGADIRIVSAEPVEVSSTQLRALLPRRGGREYLDDSVYSYIIKRRLYAAKPDFAWLREKSQAYLKPNRIPHVLGTEREAASLAERWGADIEDAREAAILHDITKKFSYEEHLAICEKYGIVSGVPEREHEKLMHALTGAAFARALFGVSDEVYSAIRWHTTGRENMSLLEKIIYMADYIEPNRDFDGVNILRALAYEDLDRALTLGLEMSLEDIRSRGIEPHEQSKRALAYYKGECI